MRRSYSHAAGASAAKTPARDFAAAAVPARQCNARYAARVTRSPDSPTWPITWDDVVAARARLAPYLSATPLRSYAALDDEVGAGIRVLVKHENHLPTNAFKARNGMSLLSALSPDERRRGVIAATRGNHGQGLAWAGRILGVPVTICVPLGNNPEKNAAMRGFGADVIEIGRDYDEAAGHASRLATERDLFAAHSTNDPRIIAGAATITAEILEQDTSIDAIVVAVGGGSQAVGALVSARHLAPAVRVHGVQAAGASAIHDAWHAGQPVAYDRADTFADGLATRATYAMTFGALRDGLAGFTTATEPALADAVRMLLRTTHNLAEGAGAAGLAGLLALRDQLANKTVAIILSGSNIDADTLRRVMTREI
jgi:threonine dehydratase